MKNKLNRRDFIKKTCVAVAGLSLLPLTGWASGLSTMLSIGVNPSNNFSLLKLNTFLSGYKFPFTNQFSTASFISQYKLYNLLGDTAVYGGDFSLQSTIKGENRQFDFLIWRLANNGIVSKRPIYKYFVSGVVKCKIDTTFSPETWTVSSQIATAVDSLPFNGTGLKNEGVIENGEIIIKSSGKTIKKEIGSMPLSWKWGLPAVVQNMAISSLEELTFSMLDEFDLIYKSQTLKFSQKVTLDCGDDKMIEFSVFVLTGDGVIPTVYWVDNLNRVVFIINGMEAYVLQSTAVTDLPNQILYDRLSLYPNPTNHTLFVKNVTNKPVLYSVFNTHGQVSQQGEMNDNQIDVSELNTGSYLIRLTDNERSVITSKFIKN